MIESDVEVVSLLRPVIYLAEVGLLRFVTTYSEPPIYGFLGEQWVLKSWIEEDDHWGYILGIIETECHIFENFKLKNLASHLCLISSQLVMTHSEWVILKP